MAVARDCPRIVAGLCRPRSARRPTVPRFDLRNDGCRTNTRRGSLVWVLCAHRILPGSAHACAVGGELCPADDQLLPLRPSPACRNLVCSALVPRSTSRSSSDISRCKESYGINAIEGCCRSSEKPRSPDRQEAWTRRAGQRNLSQTLGRAYRRLARFRVLEGILAFLTSPRL